MGWGLRAGGGGTREAGVVRDGGGVEVWCKAVGRLMERMNACWGVQMERGGDSGSLRMVVGAGAFAQAEYGAGGRGYSFQLCSTFGREVEVSAGVEQFLAMWAAMGSCWLCDQVECWGGGTGGIVWGWGSRWGYFTEGIDQGERHWREGSAFEGTKSVR